MIRIPTAPVAALALLAGYGVAVGSGSRPLGGAVMLAIGSWCIAVWLRRDGRRTAALLTAVAFACFAASHVLALVIGAWPAVLAVAVVAAAVAWSLSDAPALRRASAG